MCAFVSGDMYNRAKLSTDEKAEAARCLVIGASGGLGTAMLKLLSSHKGKRPHVTAVCSETNFDLVKRLGAQEVVNYKEGPIELQLAEKEKFDVVFDFFGGAESEKATLLLKGGGKFITAVGPMSALGDRVLSCWEWHSWACGLTGRICKGSLPCAKYSYEMAGGMPPMKAAQFNEVVVDAGFRAEVALEVPFEEGQIREALRRVASRHTSGKVVINMERS